MMSRVIEDSVQVIEDLRAEVTNLKRNNAKLCYAIRAMLGEPHNGDGQVDFIVAVRLARTALAETEKPKAL